ncbi:rhodanese-like domain-containing protein [Caballeronia sp. LZ032]|uniref:rhodanese-like domain-containing protein n=1 Tax=Caballeronia sp. LZ032 TaxID=3038565 RepID=UPI002858C9B9|nr:rhodanese-like domain-containing protein [Caballeronia sp. LZ032]MDR5880248.1 rhodanese-like domain-containing protein [Caballeronia sp. LZ032]
MPFAIDAFRFIDAATLRAWLNDGRELALLDVREAGQFGEGHPFFAIPLPFSRLELDAPRLLPRTSVRIVLIDDGATASGAGIDHAPVAQRAAARLHALGYSNVAVLEGGAPAWQRAGRTLFRGVNVPSKTFGELVEHAYGTPHVSASQLARWRAERGGCPLALIDGRTREEHRKMAVPGAVCVPNGELPAWVDAFAGPPDTTIVVHCAGRTRSIIGAQTLRNLGVRRDVFALENGTQGWALAGLTLEHGSTGSYADLPPLSEAERDTARERARALAERFGVSAVDAGTVRQWLGDPARTTYLFDVRTAEEYRRDGLPLARHAPGGQLIQATDHSVAVRNARIVLVDHDGIRAPVVAHWLVQLGYETAIVEAGSLASTSAEAEPSSTVDEDAPVDPAALILDLRASEAHQISRPAGSIWTNRVRVFDALRARDVQRDAPLIVFADARSRDAARLVVQDLRDADYTGVTLAAHGINGWSSAGWPVDDTPLRLAPEDRIDFLYFVHDRHDGNLDAARAYLEWETGLIAQCAEDELAVFRVGEAALSGR